jgi:hypothetical protein
LKKNLPKKKIASLTRRNYIQKLIRQKISEHWFSIFRGKFVKIADNSDRNICSRSDSPIMHPLMTNNNNAYPILANGNGCAYGTLGRRIPGQNFVAAGSMSLGRPRSDRFCDEAIVETHFQHPKRVQVPLWEGQRPILNFAPRGKL